MSERKAMKLYLLLMLMGMFVAISWRPIVATAEPSRLLPPASPPRDFPG
jgi:hypothetical protein